MSSPPVAHSPVDTTSTGFPSSVMALRPRGRCSTVCGTRRSPCRSAMVRRWHRESFAACSPAASPPPRVAQCRTACLIATCPYDGLSTWARSCELLAAGAGPGSVGHLESFGGCMLGQLCPPGLLVALSILEGLFFRAHGIESISLTRERPRRAIEAALGRPRARRRRGRPSPGSAVLVTSPRPRRGRIAGTCCKPSWGRGALSRWASPGRARGTPRRTSGDGAPLVAAWGRTAASSECSAGDGCR